MSVESHLFFFLARGFGWCRWWTRPCTTVDLCSSAVRGLLDKAKEEHGMSML